MSFGGLWNFSNIYWRVFVRSGAHPKKTYCPNLTYTDLVKISWRYSSKVCKKKSSGKMGTTPKFLTTLLFTHKSWRLCPSKSKLWRIFWGLLDDAFLTPPPTICRISIFCNCCIFTFGWWLYFSKILLWWFSALLQLWGSFPQNRSWPKVDKLQSSSKATGLHLVETDTRQYLSYLVWSLIKLKHWYRNAFVTD